MWKPGDSAKLVDGTLCVIVRIYKNGSAQIRYAHPALQGDVLRRCSLGQLVPLSTQRMIAREECTNLKMVAGNEQRFTRVIIEHDVQHWVGMGWIVERPATEEDYRQYAVVIDA